MIKKESIKTILGLILIIVISVAIFWATINLINNIT